MKSVLSEHEKDRNMGIYTKKGGIAEKDLNDHITPLLHF